jgi:hypothetical protein
MFGVEFHPVFTFVICFHVSHDKVTDLDLQFDCLVLLLLHLSLEDVDEIQALFRLIPEGVVISQDSFEIAYCQALRFSIFKLVQIRCKRLNLNHELYNHVSFVFVLDFDAAVHN